jgi:hypothetical protein
VGATAQGVSHRQQNIPCQDSCHWEELPGGVLIAAVADGCGSARHAALGSEWATQSALNQAAKSLAERLPASPAEWHELLRAVLQRARQILVEQATDLGVKPDQLATTLLVALLTSECLAAAQVGDGAIVVRLGDERLEAVTRPPAAEYLSETVFLTSESYLDRAQLTVQPGPITGLGMFTDGLQMLALQMPQGRPHERFFAPLFQVVAQAPPDKLVSQKQLTAFLQSPPVAARAHDDLLLLLAVPEKTERPRRQGRQTIIKASGTATTLASREA